MLVFTLYSTGLCWHKTGVSWTSVDLELPLISVPANIHQVQAINELQESTELTTELSVLPADPASLVQAPQIGESSAPSMWSKERKCSISSTDAGKIGTCKEIGTCKDWIQ